tara:strand:- start:488 stop:1249 length:762 start_codon:yes stop_codon:yes gene_type:complete
VSTNLLGKLGLTKGEIKVYLAVNEVGKSTVGPIGKCSGVSKSKVYEVLEKLIRKGFVGYVLQNGTKFFVANDPAMILEYAEKQQEKLRETRKQLEEFVPQLSLKRDSNVPIVNGEMYEGLLGIKSIRSSLLKSCSDSDVVRILGVPDVANVVWGRYLDEFHEERLKLRIKGEIIYNPDAMAYAKKRVKLDLTEVKFLPRNTHSSSWIDIYPDAVLTVIVAKQPMAFLQRSSELAKAYAVYFDILWKQAKVLKD